MSDYTYQLVVQTGPQTGEVYNLTQDLIVLGRDPVSDIVVNDLEVSRQHARLTRSGSGYTIQDMGSTNGTFLDGKRLSGEPVPVVAGQMVSVGSNVTLLFMAVAAGAAAAEVAVAEAAVADAAVAEAAVAEAAVAEAAVAEAAVADVASGTVLELPEADIPPDLPLSLPEEEFIPDPLGAVAFSEPENEKPESWPEPLADAAAKEILESRPLPVFRFDEEKAEPELAKPVEPEALLLPNFSVEASPEAAKPDYGSYRPTPPTREQAPPPAGNDKKRRNITIIVVALAIIICCCCGFALVMYYWLGDILLEMMGYTAALFPWLLF